MSRILGQGSDICPLFWTLTERMYIYIHIHISGAVKPHCIILRKLVFKPTQNLATQTKAKLERVHNIRSHVIKNKRSHTNRLQLSHLNPGVQSQTMVLKTTNYLL